MEKLSPCQENHLTDSYLILKCVKTREQQRRLTGFVHFKVLDCRYFIELSARIDSCNMVTELLILIS